jgi:hypothetical protein
VGATPPVAPTVIPTPPSTGARKSTVTPRPAATATPTPPPPVINFSISPKTATWNCHNQGMVPGALTITLDNRRSTVAVGWSATAVETVAGGTWAALGPSSGRVPAAGTQTLTLTPDPAASGAVCVNSGANGTPWHVSIMTDRAGSYTFTETIYYYLT